MKNNHRQKSNLYTKQSLYRDIGTISIKLQASKDNAEPNYKASNHEDNEGIKNLKNIVGSSDGAKVARLANALLRLYAVEQKR